VRGIRSAVGEGPERCANRYKSAVRLVKRFRCPVFEVISITWPWISKATLVRSRGEHQRNIEVIDLRTGGEDHPHIPLRAATAQNPSIAAEPRNLGR